MRLLSTICCSFLFSLAFIHSQPIDPVFTQVNPSGQAIVNPVDITGAGDNSGRLFIVEKRGTIRIMQNNAILPDTFLDIRNLVEAGGERGLLGLAFHPDYPNTPHVYLNYVSKGTITSNIARYTRSEDNPNKLDKDSGVILFSVTGEQTNHKAGDLCFGPDGYLYITTGDGGGSFGPNDHAQNINSLLGKILRIDVNVTTPPYYTSPPDNPYVGVPGDDRIWYIGLRNPWRISFDRETGDMWIADVGQNQWEEVNYIPAGSPGGLNFGWDCHEGNHPTSESGECPMGTQFVWPVFEYSHSLGASITGGFVFRGQGAGPLQGYYIVADYISDQLWLLENNNTNPPAFTAHNDNYSAIIEDIVAFGEADNGELYAVGLDGEVYIVGDGTPLPIQWVGINAIHIDKGSRIQWIIHDAQGVDHFEVQRAPTHTFENVQSVGNVQPKTDQVNYSFDDLFLQSAGVYYRVVAWMTNGNKEYSPITRILPDPVSKPVLVYDAGTNLWRVQIPQGWENGLIRIYDLQGKEVYTKKVNTLKLVELGPPVIPGAYFIHVNTEIDSWSDRFVW